MLSKFNISVRECQPLFLSFILSECFPFYFYSRDAVSQNEFKLGQTTTYENKTLKISRHERRSDRAKSIKTVSGLKCPNFAKQNERTMENLGQKDRRLRKASAWYMAKSIFVGCAWKLGYFKCIFIIRFNSMLNNIIWLSKLCINTTRVCCD